MIDFSYNGGWIKPDIPDKIFMPFFTPDKERVWHRLQLVATNYAPAKGQYYRKVKTRSGYNLYPNLMK